MWKQQNNKSLMVFLHTWQKKFKNLFIHQFEYSNSEEKSFLDRLVSQVSKFY